MINNVASIIFRNNRIFINSAAFKYGKYILNCKVRYNIPYYQPISDVMCEILNGTDRNMSIKMGYEITHAVCLLTSITSPNYYLPLHIAAKNHYILKRLILYKTKDPNDEEVKEVLIGSGDLKLYDNSNSPNYEKVVNQIIEDNEKFYTDFFTTNK